MRQKRRRRFRSRSSLWREMADVWRLPRDGPAVGFRRAACLHLSQVSKLHLPLACYALQYNRRVLSLDRNTTIVPLGLKALFCLGATQGGAWKKPQPGVCDGLQFMCSSQLAYRSICGLRWSLLRLSSIGRTQKCNAHVPLTRHNLRPSRIATIMSIRTQLVLAIASYSSWATSQVCMGGVLKADDFRSEHSSNVSKFS